MTLPCGWDNAGLSVLAYRYEGLREEDLKKVVKSLQEEMWAQSGPFPA